MYGVAYILVDKQQLRTRFSVFRFRTIRLDQQITDKQLDVIKSLGGRNDLSQ